MFLMRADPLWGHVGGGWALEIKFFWGLKWQREKRVPLGPKKLLEIVPKRIFFSVHAKASFRNSIQDHSWLSEQFFESWAAIWNPEQPSKRVSERIFKNSKFFRTKQKLRIYFLFITKGHPNFLITARAHTESTDVIFKTSRKHSSHDFVSLRPNKGNRRRERTGRSWNSHASWVSGWYRPFTGQCCLIYTK